MGSLYGVLVLVNVPATFHRGSRTHSNFQDLSTTAPEKFVSHVFHIDLRRVICNCLTGRSNKFGRVPLQLEKQKNETSWLRVPSANDVTICPSCSTALVTSPSSSSRLDDVFQLFGRFKDARRQRWRPQGLSFRTVSRVVQQQSS